MSAPAAATGGLGGHLDGFVRAVREAGIPVGISQAVDAAEILTVVDLLDREQLRHGLAAVLLQRAAQRPTYDVLFDLWWPLSDRPWADGGEGGDGGDDDGTGEPGEPTLDVPGADDADLAELMRAELLRRLLDGDPEALRRFAREAVDRLGRGTPSPSGQSFFSYRVLRALRALELKKSPSISETLDWAQTLLELGLDTLDESAMRSTLGVVLKHASDQVRAAAELRLN